MIFSDRVTVILKEKKFVAGTATFVEVFRGPVPGIVTTLAPSVTFDPTGNKVHSRLQIFLSPFGFDIPPMPASSNFSMSWGPFTAINVEGMVEPHYLNGRLHHYEIIAAAFT